MNSEIIGMCPCCYSSKKSAAVDIYVSRNKEGDITNMHIFGDDDFDLPSSQSAITQIEVSEDGKNITDIVCPRCKEHIAVQIPVIKDLKQPISRTNSGVVNQFNEVESQIARQ